MRGCLVTILCCLAYDASVQRANAEDQPPRPHVLFLLADDLGWKNVGFHGGEPFTPHIDALAASGVRLEQFYVQPVCSPTRSSLMTGRYPIRHGLQVGVIRPWARYGLPLEERTLADALREAGYKTGISGKWHLGLHAAEYLPTQRGFDLQYGHYCGALDYFTHRRDGGHDWHRNDQAVYDEGYSTDLIADEAVKIIRDHDSDVPLFLYVPFNAPHTPLQAPQKYIDKFAHIANRKHRIYAAMVAAMDDGISRILTALDDAEMREQTLVFFCSDNGGPSGTADNGRLRGWKGTVYEGGIRVPACASWPGVLPAGAIVNEPLHIVDIYPTLLNLAGASLDQPLPLDGKNAWQTIASGKPTPHDEILHQLEPSRAALRQGDWKLVMHFKRGRENSETQVELFNIAKDPYEKTDLSQSADSGTKSKLVQMIGRVKQYQREAVPPRGGAGKKPSSFKTPTIWGEG